MAGGLRQGHGDFNPHKRLLAKNVALNDQQAPLTTASELRPVASETWRELIKRTWEVDPLRCPQCGRVYPHAIHIRRLCALACAFERDKGLDRPRRQVIIAV